MRLRRLPLLGLALLIASSSVVAAETFVQRLLRVTGLTASPTQMRAPGDDVVSGDIWIATVGGPPPVQLSSSGSYRSPIFSPADGSILALDGDVLAAIPAAGGAPSRLLVVPGLAKLIGFDARNADEIVVLLSQGSSPIGVLSLKSGKVSPLEYDSKSEAEQRLLAQARGQDRIYGDMTVYLNTETKRGLSRTVEWTDVYLSRANQQPQNISTCNGVSCGQPALSPDGRLVVFVKTRG
jgi:hypothetical protein